MENEASQIELPDLSAHGFSVTKWIEFSSKILRLGFCYNAAGGVFLAHNAGSKKRWFVIKTFKVDGDIEVVQTHGNVFRSVSLNAGSKLIRKFQGIARCYATEKEVKREVRMLRHVSHTNIIDMRAAFVTDRTIIVSMPCAMFGSMKEVQRTMFEFGVPEKTLLGVVSQVLDAMVYLHKQDIVHRAVSPAHMLVDVGGHVRLTGMRNAFALKANSRATDFDEHLYSTIYYLAPEVLAQDIKGYDTQSDVYSLGISLCELANGVMPFEECGSLQMLHHKLFGRTPRPIDRVSLREDLARLSDDDLAMIPAQHREREFSEAFRSFITDCLRLEPLDRPNTKTLKTSSWIASGGKSGCRNHLADVVTRMPNLLQKPVDQGFAEEELFAQAEMARSEFWD